MNSRNESPCIKQCRLKDDVCTGCGRHIEEIKQAGRRKNVRVEWSELKFPPFNLWNIYPTPAMCALHASYQDAILWDEYD